MITSLQLPQLRILRFEARLRVLTPYRAPLRPRPLRAAAPQLTTQHGVRYLAPQLRDALRGGDEALLHGGQGGADQCHRGLDLRGDPEGDAVGVELGGDEERHLVLEPWRWG